ncbi:16S rRNA (uracil(1498)-N(3))-methyltransferase [Tepidamorphus sp. 3E244]|uniref:16S rRNA (uracil(1498)-N(3))-methyltransferase n=1 Tax=Tepidamorphus sp. 3E244 TaxID=3385498 RepID=UPI0038FC829F
MKSRDTNTSDSGHDTGSGRHVPRLYLDAPLRAGEQIALEKSQAHRLVTVMRRREGDNVIVFNGRDGEFETTLSNVTKKAARLDITGLLRSQGEPQQLTLAFAPLKHARLDYVAQKAAELGVAAIQPVITAHTNSPRFNADKFRANVIEGTEQCGVLWVADVREPLPLAKFLQSVPGNETLVHCDEAAPVANPVVALRNVAMPVTVLIGPEGGFSGDERAALRDHPRARAVSLGPRIMRADTAAVAALSLVQTICGDWRKGSSSE